VIKSFATIKFFIEKSLSSKLKRQNLHAKHLAKHVRELRTDIRTDEFDPNSSNIMYYICCKMEKKIYAIIDFYEE